MNELQELIDWYYKSGVQSIKSWTDNMMNSRLTLDVSCIHHPQSCFHCGQTTLPAVLPRPVAFLGVLH